MVRHTKGKLIYYNVSYHHLLLLLLLLFLYLFISIQEPFMSDILKYDIIYAAQNYFKKIIYHGNFGDGRPFQKVGKNRLHYHGFYLIHIED